MGDKLISARGTFFYKFAFPPIYLGLVAIWSVYMTFVLRGKEGPPSFTLGSFFGLAGLGWGLHWFVPYLLPLKQVWLGERGLRISNFRVRVFIHYRAIERVVQKPESDLRYVIVTSGVATPFGRRFTFIPWSPKFRFPSRTEDEVVVELRSRVEAARQAGKPPSKPVAGPGRSPMADDELDGPTLGRAFRPPVS